MMCMTERNEGAICSFEIGSHEIVVMNDER